MNNFINPSTFSSTLTSLRTIIECPSLICILYIKPRIAFRLIFLLRLLSQCLRDLSVASHQKDHHQSKDIRTEPYRQICYPHKFPLMSIHSNMQELLHYLRITLACFIIFQVTFPTTNISYLISLFSQSIVMVASLIILSETISDPSAILVFIWICDNSIYKLIIMEIAEIFRICFENIKLSSPLHPSFLPFPDILANRTDISTYGPMSLVVQPRALIIMVFRIVIVLSLSILHPISPLAFINDKQIGRNGFLLKIIRKVANIFIKDSFPMRLPIFELAMVFMLIFAINVLAVPVELPLGIELTLIIIVAVGSWDTDNIPFEIGASEAKRNGG